MSNAHAGDTGESLLDRFSEFLHRYRVLIWGVLGAAAVFLIVYFAVDEIRETRTERATSLVEEAATHLSAWASSEDEESAAAALSLFAEKIDLILAKYPRLYASQRALYLRAQYHVRAEEWALAAGPFLDLASRFPKSYLAPLSLFNAAVCQEEAGNGEAALQSYTSLVADYPESHLAAHALFAAGRLHEGMGAPEEALAAYTRLEDEFPASTWTQMAKNRIIALELRG